MMGPQVEADIARRYELLAPHLDERRRRLWAGAEALAAGRGGREMVARATGLSRSTVLAGMKEALAAGPVPTLVSVRRRGAGRKPIECKQPGIREALEELVTTGADESPLLWTCKSNRVLSVEMGERGFKVSPRKVAELLGDLGYTLELTRGRQGEESLRAREARFRELNQTAMAFLSQLQPVFSVGLPKGLGPHERPNRPLASAESWPQWPTAFGHSIARWWREGGSRTYLGAEKALVLVECNGHTAAVPADWRSALGWAVSTIGLHASVMDLPPGTRRWRQLTQVLRSRVGDSASGTSFGVHELVIELPGLPSKPRVACSEQERSPDAPARQAI